MTKILATLFALISFSAFAADKAMFDIEDFKKAQSENHRILVEVTAPWCPTCKAQKPIIDKLTALPENNALKVFIVDYDTQKEEMRFLKSNKQSTLIMYKGATETARTVGDTSEAGITKLVLSAK